MNSIKHVLERAICNLYALELEAEGAIPKYLDNKLQKADGSSHQDLAKERPQKRQAAITGRAKISEMYNTEDEF